MWHLSVQILNLVLIFNVSIALPSLSYSIMTKDTVTNVFDNGAGSLRNAIADASEGDTICFSSSLDGDTIKLDSKLVVNKNLTIIGNDSTNTIIDGQAVTEAFWIDSLDTVKIVALTIQNSQRGIFNRGHLIINQLAIKKNTGFGGIYNLSSGNMTIQNSCISHNHSSNAGGGIFNNGTMKIEHSLITQNDAGSDGGGIVSFSYPNTLELYHCMVRNNCSSTIGGGIWAQEGAFIMVQGEVTNNMSQSGAGGLGLSEVTGYISKSTFNNNFADGNGGGILILQLVDSIKISKSSFKGNQGAYGGGMNINGGVIIFNCALSGNLSTKGGGGITSNNDNSVIGSTICGNKTIGEFDIGMMQFEGTGGGIYHISGNLTLANTIIASNLTSEFGPDIINTGNIQVINDGYNLIGNDSDIQGNIPGINIIGTAGSEGDPGLIENVDTTSLPNSTGNLRLRQSSVALDMGTPDTTGLMIDSFDLDQKSRLNGRIDIGAYENPFINCPESIIINHLYSPLIGLYEAQQEIQVGVGVEIDLAASAQLNALNTLIEADFQVPQTSVLEINHQGCIP